MPQQGLCERGLAEAKYMYGTGTVQAHFPMSRGTLDFARMLHVLLPLPRQLSTTSVPRTGEAKEEHSKAPVLADGGYPPTVHRFTVFYPFSMLFLYVSFSF